MVELIQDFDCPFPDCGAPVVLEDERMMRSSDECGFCIVAFFRCARDHYWPVVRAA